MGDYKRYIVEFQFQTDSSVIEAVGGKVRHDYANMSELLSAELTEEQVQELLSKPIIKEIRACRKGAGAGQGMDWGYVKTKVDTRYRGTYSGSGVKVALLDTGLAHHEDLPTAYRFIDYVSGQSSQYDDDEHGTFVAGIISMQDNSIGYVGVAPDVKLYVAKVLDYEGRGYVDDFVAGIDWAVSQNVDIINFSIYTDEYEQDVVDATRRAYNAGIIVVAIAGNGTMNDFVAVNEIACPGADYSCLAVGSINSDEVRSSFSNYGSGLDLVAPGENIISTVPSFGYPYGYWSGTSFAAAYVTGHLACIKEKYPSYSRSQLVDKLLSNAKYLGSSLEYGAGLVQAEPIAPPLTPISAPVIISRGEGELELQWGQSQYAEAYTLRYKHYDGIYHTVSNIAQTYYRLTNLEYGVTYSLSVRGDCGSLSSAYTSENPGTTTPKTPSPITCPAVTYNTIDIEVPDGITGNWDYIRIYAFNNSISPSYKDISRSSYNAGSRTVVWTNLLPGKSYQFSAVSYLSVNGVILNSSASVVFVTTNVADRPNNFHWTTPKHSGDPATTLTAAEWNTFINRINEFRVYKGLVSYNFTNAYSGNYFTAAMFNQARNAIADMNLTNLPGVKNRGDFVYASQLNALVSCLNEVV
jgi:hypothetical protein